MRDASSVRPRCAAARVSSRDRSSRRWIVATLDYDGAVGRIPPAALPAVERWAHLKRRAVRSGCWMVGFEVVDSEWQEHQRLIDLYGEASELGHVRSGGKEHRTIDDQLRPRGLREPLYDGGCRISQSCAQK